MTREKWEARASGEPPLDSDVGISPSHFKRVLNTTLVKAQATCLLRRMGNLGGAAMEAAKRRNIAVRQDPALRNEGWALFQAHVRSRGFHGSGDIVH